MPTLIAMLAASVVAWVLDDWIRATVGLGASMLISTIAGGVAFFYAKRFISDLRGDS
jgi:uncharacterized membrane-anchored protein